MHIRIFHILRMQSECHYPTEKVNVREGYAQTSPSRQLRILTVDLHLGQGN